MTALRQIELIDEKERRLLAILQDSCINAACRAVYPAEYESVHAERAEAERLVEELASAARQQHEEVL